MLVQKIIEFADKQIHQKRIVNFLKEKSIKIIIDVGTHKGEFINCFLEINSVKKIFAFEPQKKIFELLKKKFLDNKKVYLNNIALDNHDGKKEIKINKMSSTSTLNDINDTSFYFKFKSFLLFEKNSVVSQYEINTTSLDNFFLNESLQDNTLIKIDTEGYEFNILKGLTKQLLKKINFIYFEHHYDLMIKKNYNFSDINSFLLKNNFKLKFKLKMKLRKTFEYIYENRNK